MLRMVSRRSLIAALPYAFVASLLMGGVAYTAQSTFYGLVIGSVIGSISGGTVSGSTVTAISQFNGPAMGLTNVPIAQLTPLSPSVFVCTTPAGILTGSCSSVVLPQASGGTGRGTFGANVVVTTDGLGNLTAGTAAPAISGANFQSATIPNGALAAQPLDALTSSDGSVIVTGSGNTRDVSIVQTGGYAAGNVQYRLRYNYGSSVSSIESLADQSISPQGSLLGSVSHNTGTFPTTTEAIFKVKVKPGAGAQTISGSCNDSGSFLLVALDGTTVASGTGSGTFAWSTTVPDDGAQHTLVLHSNNPTAAIHNVWSAWVPQNAYGGMDISKIASVVPGS